MTTDKTLTSERIGYWAKQSLWGDEELKALCCGLEPRGSRPSNEALNEAGESIRRAVLAGDLIPLKFDSETDRKRLYGCGDMFFNPKDAALWVKGSGLFPKFPKLSYKILLSSEATITDSRLLLKNSDYWQGLEKKAVNVIEKYPAWSKTVKTIQKEANLKDWIIKVAGVNVREQDIIKKVLSDVFPELNKNN